MPEQIVLLKKRLHLPLRQVSQADVFLFDRRREAPLIHAGPWFRTHEERRWFI